MAESPQNTVRSKWLKQRHDHFVRQLVDDFFLQVESFQQLYSIYLDCRNLGDHVCVDLLSPATEVARGQIWYRLTQMIGTETEKGQLWQLKDLCHLIWPEQEQQRDVHGALIDWLLGSIFHEAMKLKENIYLLNTYGPAAVRMEKPPATRSEQILRSSGSFPQLSSIVDVEALVRRIAKDVVSQMEQIGLLLGQANFILRMMMPGLASNMLVVRLLVEEEERTLRVWGETVEELFTDMFSGDAAQGFCAAGRSYLSGQWYPQALDMYKRALQADQDCDEARARIAQLQAMLTENTQLQSWGLSKNGSAVLQ
jgi:hypothetical protein